MDQYFFFFFQAEDGIRDYKVTGVQTCALPILKRAGATHLLVEANARELPNLLFLGEAEVPFGSPISVFALKERRELVSIRSEERRVGKECRSGKRQVE